jgi:RNA polymerase sigma factor (sigma-70 family)
MKANPDELILTRASLLKRLKDWEDATSWQEFFDIYWKLIYGVARKSGLTDVEAQDVVQVTMADIAKQMPNFTYDPALGSFKGWLLKLTRWRIIDQIRKRRHFVELPSGDRSTDGNFIDQIADKAAKTVDSIWEDEYRKNLLETAKANVKRVLDPLKYQIFDFYVNKDWPPEKVAERFKTSVANVYVIKHRVTDALREEVERLEREMK